MAEAVSTSSPEKNGFSPGVLVGVGAMEAALTRVLVLMGPDPPPDAPPDPPPLRDPPAASADALDPPEL